MAKRVLDVAFNRPGIGLPPPKQTFHSTFRPNARAARSPVQVVVNAEVSENIQDYEIPSISSGVVGIDLGTTNSAVAVRRSAYTHTNTFLLVCSIMLSSRYLKPLSR